VRPDVPTPAAYRELAEWQQAAPADAGERGPWWQVYGDPTLDDLESRVSVYNQTLAAAEAAYRESRALVNESRASYWPSVTVNGGDIRSQRGAAAAQTVQSAGAIASWEPDIWGSIRRSVESARASAAASSANLAAVRLSLQATLATDYFELRIQDGIQSLLDATVSDYQQALQITENRYRAGVATRADVVTAQTQLLSVQAQQLNTGILRAELEHAIAVLVGQPPANLILARAALPALVPVVPVGVPSDLLQRRPDIATAERQVAAANARIGVAHAAFFPNLTLSASDSYSNNVVRSLFQIPNRIWSYGPALAASLFDGGTRSARVAQAHASAEQSAALYRQSVLNAFREVEDGLTNLRVLQQQAAVEDTLVKSAREAETLTLNQYKAGTAPYSSVITAQTTTLNSEQSALAVLRGRLTGSVALIADLGGDWQSGSATPAK
jgi:NodT family efflux transporter outer membrane factor (OMF) lipoprotein